ncbi:unnamed protein product, partial [Rotaria sp. Silwood2]
MNRTKDTIDLAYEELERAIAEARGYESDELSESEAVVGPGDELTPLVETTPNLLDTAIYEVSDTSSYLLSSNAQLPYPLRPTHFRLHIVHYLGQNYREVTAALHSVMDCISQQQKQQQHHMVSLLSPTTGLSRQPIVMAPTTPVIVISTDRHPSTPEGYKSIGTMPMTPAGVKSTATDPLT